MNSVVALCYVGWLFDFYDLVLFSFLIPFIGPDLGLSVSSEAWLLGIALGASGVGGIVFGWLADRYGRRRVMTWTIVLFSAGTSLSALAPNLGALIALRTVTGLGIGGEWAIGHALVAETTESSHRGRAAALLQTGEPVGVALAAIVGLLLTPLIGWRWVMGLSGISALWALVVRARLPESPLWTKVVRDPSGAAADSSPLAGAAPPAGSAARQARERGRAWLLSRSGLWTMFRSFILATFKLGTYWTCYIWLPKFFLTRFHEPIGISALWILTAQAGQFGGMLLFGRFADRIGRRPTYAIYSAITAIALATLAFDWRTLLQTRPLFWSVMLLLGFGSGCTAGFGSLFSELFPTEVRNFAMGTAYNLARGMQLFAPPLVAFFALRWDLAGALSVPLVLAIATGCWIWVLPETRGRNLAEV